MKNEFVVGAVIGSLVMSAVGVVNSYISGKKISDLESKLEKRGDEILKATETKTKDISTMLEKKVNGIAEQLDVDIPDDILERALNKAADSAAKRAIDETSRKVLEEYSITVRSEVRKSVDLAYQNTKVDVKNELSKQIANLDISGIKQEIVDDARRKVEDELEEAINKIKSTFEDELEEAKDDAKEKFEEELDSISTRFSNDLERGSKIYKAMSEKLGMN